MKCQRCPKPATFHITEVFGHAKYRDFHLCEECAQRHLANPDASLKAAQTATPPLPDADLTDEFGGKHCPACGLKFVEFRNSGRLGCPRDYDVFKDELLPLLDNIHGDTKHAGKQPRLQPTRQANAAERERLRGELESAIRKEAYEEAARLRDRLRQLDDPAPGA
ncbi:MAG: UvrB/UvrC motif-containing protein [Planctomycetia bacterium]|nr:UvrB/UvrC motif-containing protein [Planctomycetia bacterium]